MDAETNAAGGATSGWWRWRLALVLTVLASLALGWHLRWLLDDAYISFRYAWNLVHGYGLVFNPGESPPVEGYTNFLWTLIAALPIALGLDPTYPSVAISLVSAAVTLIATWQLARRILPGELAPWLAVVVVGFNYSFLCFVATALETQLQTALITGGLALAAGLPGRGWPAGRSVGLSLCGAAALLNRMDAAVPLAVVLVWLVWRLTRGDADRATLNRRLVLLAGPATLIVGGWLAWKLAYYGELLPNTWYARDTGVSQLLQWRRGLAYVGGFLTDYWFWPFVLLALGRLRCWRDATYVLSAAVFLAWAAYVVHAGGDYMEYRFMIVALPALVVVVLAAARSLHPTAVPVLAICLLSASWFEGRANDGSPIGHGRLERLLLDQADPSDNYWSRFGESVRQLPGGESLVWTLPQLGIPGYYSRLPIVDTHGLTDRWVAREGRVRDGGPGHDKYAPVDYLRARGVNLAESFGQPCYWYFYYTEDLAGEKLVVFETHLFWYVTPHPVIDRLVEQERVRLGPMPSREECEALAAR